MFMRGLLILLVFLSATVVADDITIGEAIKIEEKSLFEYLKGMGKSDCQAFLDNGDAIVNSSLKALGNKDWDEMFYYDREAFHMYLRAFGYCDDEPENKQKARERLDDHFQRGKIITCAYHMTEAQDAYQRATLALDQFEDPIQSLSHAKSSVYSLNDSERFCKSFPEKMEAIKQLKELVGESITILEKYVEKYPE